MKKQHLQNEEIDRIGRELLNATSVQDDVIEKIIASPKLFDSIQSKINAEILQRQAKVSRSNLGWNWQFSGATFGVLIVLIIGIIFYNFSIPKTEIQIAQSQSSDFQIQHPPSKMQNIALPKPIKQTKLAQPIVLKKTASKSIKPIQIKLIQRQEDEFMPINFATDLEIAKQDGRIIRVELSRGSLLALGVKVPIDDENPTVKAEFLISSDGITKGVRVVK